VKRTSQLLSSHLRLCVPGRRSPAAAGGEMGRPVRRSLRDYGTKEEVSFA
jgi:hypothetical protein